MAITNITSVSTPTTVLAQSLEQAARRSGSEALRDFAAQIAARQTASTGSAAQVVSAAPVQASTTIARNVTAIEPDPNNGLRRPGSVLDIRV
jgi:hypothetical protein